MPGPSKRSDRRYRVLRRRVLREEPLCACGCGRASIEVDHIRPLHRGGALMARANLQGLSRRCHARKTARDRLSPERRAWRSFVDELRFST